MQQYFEDVFSMSLNGDPGQMAEAQNTIMQWKEDKFTFIAEMISALRKSPQEISQKTVKSIALYIRQEVLIIPSDKAQIPEDFAEFFKAEMLQILQTWTDTFLLRHMYDSIIAMSEAFADSWPGLIDVMLQQCSTNSAAFALEFFAAYFEKHEPESPELFSELIKLFMTDYPTELKAQLYQFKLYLSLSLSSDEFLEQGQERAVALLMNSDTLGSSAAAFTDHLRFQDPSFIGQYEFLVVALIEALCIDNLSALISVVEALQKIVASSQGQNIIIENFERFFALTIQHLSRPADIDNICITEAIIELLRYLMKNPSFRELFVQNSEGYYSSDDGFLVASLSSVNCPPESFSVLLGIIQSNEDQLISDYLFQSLINIFNDSFKEVLESEENLKPVFDFLVSLISNERAFFSTQVLSVFCEKALENGFVDFIKSIAEEIIEIINQIFNENTVLIAATLAVTIPDQIEEVAVEITDTIVEYLGDTKTHEIGINLLKYASKFLNCMSPENKLAFMIKLYACIEKEEAEEAEVQDHIVYQEGFGDCIPILGSDILSNFADPIIHLLINVLKEPVAFGFDVLMDGKQDSELFSHFHVPGSNKRFFFRNEQVNQQIHCIFNLTQIVNVFGELVGTIEGFNEAVNNVIEVNLYCCLDMHIRENTFALVASLIKAFPHTAEQFLSVFRTFFLGEISNEEQNEKALIVAEPENIVRTSALKQLTNLMSEPTIQDSFRIQISEILPRFIEIEINEIPNDNLDEYEYQEYFDCLWETMVLLNAIEKVNPAIAVAPYTAIIGYLSSCQPELPIIGALIGTLKVGFTSDFLEAVPDFSEFDNYFNFILEGIESDSSDTKGTALFGFGRVLVKHSNADPAYIDSMLEHLYSIISSPQMTEDAFLPGRENGISSFCLILQKLLTINVGVCVPHISQLLGLLPVWVDDVESKIVYSFMISCLSKINDDSIRDVIFQALGECMADERSNSICVSTVQENISMIPQKYLSQFAN